MIEVCYTLLGDGGSDRALMEIINWALKQRDVLIGEQHWADLTRVRENPKTLPDRIASAIHHYPCDILFVHLRRRKGHLGRPTQRDICC